MPHDPSALPPLADELGRPAHLPFGPNSRYAALPDAELAGWAVRLLAAQDAWLASVRRFAAVGVTPALGGPCAQALVEAQAALAVELGAVAAALTVRVGELQCAAAAGAGAP